MHSLLGDSTGVEAKTVGWVAAPQKMGYRMGLGDIRAIGHLSPKARCSKGAPQAWGSNLSEDPTFCPALLVAHSVLTLGLILFTNVALGPGHHH